MSTSIPREIFVGIMAKNVEHEHIILQRPEAETEPSWSGAVPSKHRSQARVDYTSQEG